jgi:hypothetical protein
MQRGDWLPNPPDGTAVCGGFDGSENDDWTAIRLETAEGFQFTPRWTDSGLPMIWNPAQHGGRIPRLQVHDAWAILAGRFRLVRVYCDPGFNDPHDPTSWMSEIEMWARSHGESVFIPWQMGGHNRLRAVHSALVRFEADLRTGALTHDGCPITTTHIGNARKIAKVGDRFLLGKPAQTQKIDAAVTSVLCHEATADALSAGWGQRTGLTRVTGRASAY